MPEQPEYQTRRDPDTGHVIAYNDDLQVMAIGRDEQEAAASFYRSVEALRRWEAELRP